MLGFSDHILWITCLRGSYNRNVDKCKSLTPLRAFEIMLDLSVILTTSKYFLKANKLIKNEVVKHSVIMNGL